MRLCICLLIGLSLLLCIGALAAPPASSYHLIKTIPVGGDGGWDYLTIDSPAHRLYISRSDRVIVVDVEKGSVVGEIPNTPGVHGIALVPKLHRGYISNGGDNTVSVIDLATLKETERIKVGARPDAILFEPVTNRIFTFNGGSSDTTAIDVATGKVVGTLALGGKPEFPVAEKGTIFVNIEDKSEIAAFDAKALTVKTRWSLAPGDGPSGLAMDRKNRRLFSVCSNEKMVVSDADKGRVVATATIGKGTDGAAFDSREKLAFSSNGGDGTLTVVKEESPDKFSVLETVPTQTSARTMTLDPGTHLIYLPAARYLPAPPAPPAAPGQPAPRRRRQIEPNSFVILVFGK